MPHWKLILAYDGSSFHGWQIQNVQNGLPTVQGTLAQAIAGISGETVLPQGSGRTDAGVHALGQVATFTLQSPIPAANLQRSLNRALPASIRILSAELVPDTFHARRCATAKTYEYRIFENRLLHSGGAVTERICSPFLAPFVWDCHWSLNLVSMQGAADDFLGQHDFTSFAASDPDLTERNNPSSGPSPLKTITRSTLTRESNLLIYRVTGSGFLHHMVRNIVGTLVEIGRGSLPPGAIPGILAAGNRSAAGPTAPPSGLFLVSVDYEPQQYLGAQHLDSRTWEGAATDPEAAP
jgi:tRNA pseudouridine38-40 synthase